MNARAEQLSWEPGASRWSRIRTLIISDDPGQRERLGERHDTVVVATPLELVFALEQSEELISTVLLAGRFVFDHDLARFLDETYPQVGLDRLGVEAN